MIQAVTKSLIRAIIYLRMSTDEQVVSIPDQRRDIERWAEKNGYLIVWEYKDPGISGDQWERPDFQKMLRDIKSPHDFDALLVWDFSRFSRLKQGKGMMAFGQVLDAGLEFISISDERRVTEDNVVEIILWTLQNHGNNQYVVKTSKGVSRRREILIAEGKWAGGKTPYGFAVAGVKYSRQLAPDPKTMPHLKEIFTRFSQGWSIAKLMQWLNARPDIPTPVPGKPWSHTGLRGILANEVYIGNTVFCRRSRGKYTSIVNGEIVQSANPGMKQDKKNASAHVVKNTHPPEVPLAVFETAQERLKDSRKYRNGNRVYELSGLLYCAHCEGRMSGSLWSRGNGEQVADYRCVTKQEYKRRGSKVARKPHHLCGFTVAADNILAEVREKVLTRFLTDAALEDYRSKVHQYLSSRYSQTANILESIDAKLAEAQKEIVRFAKLLGGTDDAGLIAVYEPALKKVTASVKELKAQRELESRLTAVGGEAVNGEAAAIITKLRNLRTIIATAVDPGTLRVALGQIIERIDVTVREDLSSYPHKKVDTVEIHTRSLALPVGGEQTPISIAEMVNSKPAKPRRAKKLVAAALIGLATLLDAGNTVEATCVNASNDSVALGNTSAQWPDKIRWKYGK